MVEGSADRVTPRLMEKAGLWGGIALAIARVKQASGQPVAEAI